MFRFAQHDRKADERKFLNAVSTQLDFNDRWDSAYLAPDLTVRDRWFLPSSCSALFWIFDGLF
jgi:hypothetical protein